MHVGEGRLDRGLSRRIYALLGAMAALMAIGFGPAVADAGASGSAQGPPAGPTSPPFFQCPAIGLDTTCQFLVDVKSTDPKVPPTILEDPAQGFYDGADDVTVAIQNDTTAPLGSVHLGVAGSGDGVFGLDSDGLCKPGSGPSPDGCPFGPPGNNESPFDYYGPDTVLTADPGTEDSGTVSFTTALQPGQYTYFTLEAPPSGTSIVAGEVNDTVSTELTDTEAGEIPPAAKIVVPAPAEFTDTAVIHGPNAATATGKVKYKVYSDSTCTTQVGDGGEAAVENGLAKPSKALGKALKTNATYYWQVTYSGDTNNSEAVSACGDEIMTFGTPIPPPGPAIATILSGGGQVGTKITVTTGTAVTDTAVVIPPAAQPVSGRLSYEVYTTPSCTPGTQIQGAGGGLTSGSGPTSNPLTLAIGTYYFQAAYSGNGVLGPAVSPCGSEVLTVTSPPPPPPPPPNNQFTSVGNPQVNTTNGQIVVIGQFPAPGTATSTGTVSHGATLARVEHAVAEAARKSKRCRRGFVKKKGRCVSNAPVLYGTSTLVIPAAGTYSIVLRPTTRVLEALKTGKTLDVVVSTTFQNRAGGTPVTHVQGIVVRIKKPRKHGHKKH